MMDQLERERLFKQLHDNPLFKELLLYLKQLQEVNRQARYTDLGALSTGAVLMREQGIGAENQMEDILSFINALQQEENNTNIR